MKHDNCPQEAAVAEAARSGRFDEFVMRHSAECASCQEILRMSRWMRTLGESTEENLALPDASLVWWRAHLSEKQAGAGPALSAADWVEIVSVAVALSGLAGWVLWNWQALQAALTWLAGDSWAQVVAGTNPLAGVNPSVFWLTAGAAVLIAVFLAYPMLEED
jgi:hypothetical protein